jgi:16S rRNA (cytosine967-C5)-methyltransferase
MTPSARIQSAIDILEGLSASRMPADRFIREYFRARRYAGSKDRASITERVYDVFRHRASFAWCMGSERPRALAIASVLREGADVDALFSGGYGPPPLSGEERQRIATAPAAPPLHVEGEYPEFLDSELKRAFGDGLLEEMRATLTRAPIDLRVNTLKAARGEVLEALRADGFDTTATLYSPDGIRIPAAKSLEQGKLFTSGAFEFQDEAAQIAVMLCDAKPGMRVLDLAAGAGGKSLALAAWMKNEGEIVAHDIDENRLRQIGPRAERAGVSIVRIHAGQEPPAELFDLVLLDAPCSGSGTWRRQPENKWRLTPARLDELNALQDRLLAMAASRVTPGGRLVYATCSILPRENEDRIGSFLSQDALFTLLDAGKAWTPSADLPAGAGPFFKATPLRTGTDGFFAAIVERRV